MHISLRSFFLKTIFGAKLLIKATKMWILSEKNYHYSFMRWLAGCVEIVSSQIIVDDCKIISISKDLVHYVLWVHFSLLLASYFLSHIFLVLRCLVIQFVLQSYKLVCFVYSSPLSILQFSLVESLQFSCSFYCLVFELQVVQITSIVSFFLCLV